MPTGEAIKDGILLLIGNAFLVVLAVVAFRCWATKQWGELVAVFAGAVIVAGFIYFPTQSVELLQNIWELIFG